MTIAMTMAMTTLNQTKMANTKCQGLLVGCIGCDKCRNTKETMLSGLMFQLHNQPEREWPFEDDEDEDNGDINHENDDIYGDTNTTGYKYNIGKEKCSVIHPSSVVSFTTKGHEMDLNDRGFFGNLSPMNNSNTSSNSPRSEKHQLLICGLSDENGIICNRLRNSQSEARMANGSVFCRGCNMVRTPLLKLQTEIIVSGKLQIETGIADESSEAESLSKRMIVGQGNWSNLPSKFNSHNSELDILLGNCSNSDSPSKKNGSDMKKKTETNQVKKNGKKGPGKGRKKAHDPVKNRELAVAFIKKLENVRLFDDEPVGPQATQTAIHLWDKYHESQLVKGVMLDIKSISDVRPYALTFLYLGLIDSCRALIWNHFFDTMTSSSLKVVDKLPVDKDNVEMDDSDEDVSSNRGNGKDEKVKVNAKEKQKTNEKEKQGIILDNSDITEIQCHAAWTQIQTNFHKKRLSIRFDIPALCRNMAQTLVRKFIVCPTRTSKMDNEQWQITQDDFKHRMKRIKQASEEIFIHFEKTKYFENCAVVDDKRGMQTYLSFIIGTQTPLDSKVSLKIRNKEKMDEDQDEMDEKDQNETVEKDQDEMDEKDQDETDEKNQDQDETKEKKKNEKMKKQDKANEKKEKAIKKKPEKTRRSRAQHMRFFTVPFILKTITNLDILNKFVFECEMQQEIKRMQKNSNLPPYKIQEQHRVINDDFPELKKICEQFLREKQMKNQSMNKTKTGKIAKVDKTDKFDKSNKLINEKTHKPEIKALKKNQDNVKKSKKRKIDNESYETNKQLGGPDAQKKLKIAVDEITRLLP